jgi:hypothetical protein
MAAIHNGFFLLRSAKKPWRGRLFAYGSSFLDARRLSLREPSGRAAALRAGSFVSFYHKSHVFVQKKPVKNGAALEIGPDFLYNEKNIHSVADDW